MQRQRLISALDKTGIVLALAVAILLRSDLSYRTAFLDEAYNMFGGWQLLHGQEAYAMIHHMGWYVFSYIPLGLAGWLAGLEYARALNAVWGVLTVLFVMMAARRVYGEIAGTIAAGIFAVYGPAIFISTFATYDSLSVLLVSIAVYLWVTALLENKKNYLYALGSLVMTSAVLTKYAAGMVAVLSVAYGTMVAIGAMITIPSKGSQGILIRLDRGILKKLVWTGLPFILLPLYLLVFKDQLAELLRRQVLIKQSSSANIEWQILKEFTRYLWLPMFLSLLALDERRNRAISVGFLVVGLSMLPYHLLNKDETTLFKHTCYMLVGLAPLAAGGVVTTLKSLVGEHLTRVRLSIVSSVVGLLIVGYLGVVGQQMLPQLHSYWPDTTELIQYLRTHVKQDDIILMEQGAVARYYLIARGVPGHIPQEVFETWWYEDEQGQGGEAHLFERAVTQKRFDFIVFDYTVTKDLDDYLIPTMEGRYELVASFPAFDLWDSKIDVFKAIE